MRISISFDPQTDNAGDLTAVIARIYGSGTAAPTVTISHADNPETGEDAGTPAATTNAAGGHALDSTGLRWDARIHSTPASQIANGTWRAKRGVDKALVATVTAELRGTPAGLPKGLEPIALVPAPGPAAIVPPPPPVAQLAPPTVYESFVNWISEHIKAGTMGVTEEWVSQVLTQYDIADGKVVNLQNAAPDLITNIRTAIAGALQVPAA